MRKALFAGILAVVSLPAVAEAQEVSVKIHPLEEWGVVVASAGSVSLLAGGILLGIGLDRRLPPGETADEVYIATTLMIAGAVVTGVGIPIAFMGKAKRNEEEKKAAKPSAWIVPTFGGAGAVFHF